MSIDGIISSGLSAILSNSAALRVTSDNIANVNTPGYARRQVQMQTLAPGGQLAGVQLASVQRVVNAYLDKEVLDANGAAASYDIQSSFMQQLNGALGQPGDGNSLGSQLDKLYAALGQASLDPSSLATRGSALTQFQSVAKTVSDLSSSVAGLRRDADGQIASAVTEANSLIKQIYTLNPQIQHAFVAGDTATGLLDQRDQVVAKLSSLMDLRTTTQSDGRMFVATTDGVSLVNDNYAQMTSQPSAGPSFPTISVQMLNPLTGAAIGTAQSLDAHVATGQIRGLLDMRDGVLGGIGEELGSLAQSLSLAYNAQNNANAAFPPPQAMNGRNTGLLATDALNFTGTTNIAVADQNGTLLHKYSIDFNAGTLKVDNSATSVPIGSTVGSFVTALNTAMAGSGTAAFNNGVLTLNASGGNGLVVADDGTAPSSRGGVAFSQFFGLADLFQATGSSIQTTGLSSSDVAGFAPGGSISLLLKGPNGERVNETNVPVTGTTIGDMVSALNTAFSGKASFALDANGKLQVTPSAAYSKYDLEVTLDTTARGGTGESFTSLFGIGTGEALARAQSFSLTPDIAANPQRLGFAKPNLDSSTPLSVNIVASGDNRGLLALQNLANAPLNFSAAGSLPARSVTLSDYAASFYQDVASRGTEIDASKSAQDIRAQQAQLRQSQSEGVNLDEELQKMMQLQQAYNAGARLLKTAQDLFDQLLNVI